MSAHAVRLAETYNNKVSNIFMSHDYFILRRRKRRVVIIPSSDKTVMLSSLKKRHDEIEHEAMGG
jgi:hypothetical protein